MDKGMKGTLTSVPCCTALHFSSAPTHRPFSASATSPRDPTDDPYFPPWPTSCCCTLRMQCYLLDWHLSCHLSALTLESLLCLSEGSGLLIQLFPSWGMLCCQKRCYSNKWIHPNIGAQQTAPTQPQ